MTDAQRMELEQGDRVVVRMDDGEEKEFVVKYGVWKAGGRMVVGLKGIAGGYDLARVVRKIDEPKTVAAADRGGCDSDAGAMDGGEVEQVRVEEDDG